MLSQLYIKNLAVIEEANIPFGGKFNVFTGETGAGKSILINGINSVLGKRVTKDIVRTGCESAVVTALFTELSDDVCALLDELGIDHDEQQVQLSREIKSDGRSTARINGRTAAVTVLKDIGERLVSIHGQHDNRILMTTDNHIDILDEFGRLEPLKAEYKAEFHKLQEMSKELKSLTVRYNDLAANSEYLKEARQVIEEADISENEDIKLSEEMMRVSQAENIYSALNSAVNALQAEEYGAQDTIGTALSFTEQVNDLMPEISPLMQRLESARIEVEDIAAELTHLADRTDNDPERLGYLSSRIRLIEDIKHRYGPELTDVRSLYEKAVESLDNSGELAEEINTKAAQRQEQLHLVSIKAKELSAARSKAGKDFSGAVAAELAYLNMPDTEIVVQLTQGKLTVNGMDTVEFLLSANKGEAPRPLAKIASGGELSRIMLALKNVISDEAATLIFDEIDTGVSGKAAQKIACKLRAVSRERQVLCVTHLPQIASAADDHLLIEKESDGERTYTKVYPLDHKGRMAEIARITVGDALTDTAMKNAEEMLSYWS